MCVQCFNSWIGFWAKKTVTSEKFPQFGKSNHFHSFFSLWELSVSFLLKLQDSHEVNLLEKEFDDFFEDHVHKSAGPVVFVSKTLGMLPVIWTEDETESECKSYFNLYTFVVFIGWAIFEFKKFKPMVSQQKKEKNKN